MPATGANLFAIFNITCGFWQLLNKNPNPFGELYLLLLNQLNTTLPIILKTVIG